MHSTSLSRVAVPAALGLVLALATVTSSFAESRVVFQSNKDDVKKACDGVSGVETHGEGGKGFGCYNPKNGVLVACANNGACTGYIPRGTPRKKALVDVLKFGIVMAPVEADTGGGGGGGKKDGSACGPDGCLF